MATELWRKLLWLVWVVVCYGLLVGAESYLRWCAAGWLSLGVWCVADVGVLDVGS